MKITVNSNLIGTITLVFLLFGIFVISVNADNVPEKIKTFFNSNYPLANSVKWINTGIKHKEYQVRFNQQDTIMNCSFNKEGNMVEMDKLVSPDILPDKILESLEKQFDIYKIKRCMMVIKNNSIYCYELLIKSGGVQTTVIITNDGYLKSR